jgi:3-oxoacyl-[acyl-carrier protein] reductase
MSAPTTEPVAVVTGAASGIGAAISTRFAHDGARVVLLDINGDNARTLAASLPNAAAIECDVSVSASVDAAIDDVVAQFGRIDVAVNNAGIAGSLGEVTRRSEVMERYTNELLSTLEAPPLPIDITVSMSDEDWRRMFAIHVDGTFYVTRRVLREMAQARKGSIINVSSICGMMGCVGTPSYSAAKAAIIGFTRAVAKEVANQGIRVNVVAPGFIDTSLSPVRSTTERSLTVASTPAGRLGTPDEVADAVAFLASDRSSYFVGAVLSPNGGALTA